MKARSWVGAIALLTAGASVCVAQTTGFDLNTYKQFLAQHQTLTAGGLQVMHPAGQFRASVPAPASDPVYLDTISQKYSLTPYELEQIRKHGFVVTSRLARHTFVEALGEIYHEDLPVFVSTDAILQAVHNSYDKVLIDVEKSVLRPEVTAVLMALRGQLPVLDTRYGQDPRMKTMLRDVDVYCTIPLILLGQPVRPYFSENVPWVEELMRMIGSLQPEEIPLFAATNRSVDFSQFTVRGHYTTDSTLAEYFRAMIWLGRTEMYLLAPEGTTISWPAEDIQRQVIDAALITEAVRDAGVLPQIQNMNRILEFMVGEQDNVTLDSLQAVIAQCGIQSAAELLDTTQCQEFQDLLATKPYAGQRIISQILMTDPLDPEQARPASAFLLLGQRFVIDSYVTGNVVYDKIVFEGQKVRRMLPSTLDVLFALGNDAAGQLLAPELETYHYAPNAAAMRYLVDSYPPEFWSMSMFNAWLEMIRTLNPPETKVHLPSFMQTAAWWQEKMNTQLASWAQLRHDNLLYAKQSYTPGIICSFPESYVEPIPEFFKAVTRYADGAATNFAALGMTRIQDYFLRLAETADTLRAIAEKELNGTPLASHEQVFLRAMLVRNLLCGEPYSGWYPALFYGSEFVPGDYSERNTDFVVADVHTSPTDAAGSEVGWVLHVGTGPVDLAVVCATLPDGRYYAFIGPVLNYYEHLATDFKRLTDEEWAMVYNVVPSLRPGLVNLYLADEKGESRGVGPSLLTGVSDEPREQVPMSAVLHQNYPNPFNAMSVIPFSVVGGPGEWQVRLEIFNLQGQLVLRLLDARLPSGNYTVVWKGTTGGGTHAASGVYLCRLMVGNPSTGSGPPAESSGPGQSFAQTRKLVLIR